MAVSGGSEKGALDKGLLGEGTFDGVEFGRFGWCRFGRIWLGGHAEPDPAELWIGEFEEVRLIMFADK